MRYSGLQKEVLQLYRSFLRTAYKKDMGTAATHLIRNSFKNRQDYPKRDVQAIEEFIRTGKTKLQTLQESDTKITFMNIRRK